MRKLILLLIVCIFMTSATYAAVSTGVSKKPTSSTVSIEMETKDGFLLTAKLSYPSVQQKKYPLVVLLHSIGYSSLCQGKAMPLPTPPLLGLCPDCCIVYLHRRSLITYY